MLDRAKVIKAFNHTLPQFYSICAEEIIRAQALWAVLCARPDLHASLLLREVPRSSDLHYESVAIAPLSYIAYSIDGSQIYPDRHQGFPGYLINIGSVALDYDETSVAYFESTPYIYLDEMVYSVMTPEFINAQRTAYEFASSIEWCTRYKRSKPKLFFVDGSLIFWHLADHEETIRNRLLQQYLDALDALYKENIPVVGYISLPQSKELVIMLRELQKIEDPDLMSFKGSLQTVVDTDVLQATLQPGERTTLFEHCSPQTPLYPEHLKPYFCYYHTGDEIARIELPAWLVSDIDAVISLIADQIKKGQGYPICLAEAHEQAVVTNADRDFFYHCMFDHMKGATKLGSISQKLLKKRKPGM